MLHIVNSFVEHFLSEKDLGYVGTTDKKYCYGSYQAFQCNMILLPWIKGNFNDEKGLGQKSPVQSIMHDIVGYIRLRVSGILLSNWKIGILLNLPNRNTS